MQPGVFNLGSVCSRSSCQSVHQPELEHVLHVPEVTCLCIDEGHNSRSVICADMLPAAFRGAKTAIESLSAVSTNPCCEPFKLLIRAEVTLIQLAPFGHNAYRHRILLSYFTAMSK